MKILVTGAAGFIGYHLTRKLLELNFYIYGIDNLNSYYDVSLKLARLNELGIDTHSESFYKQRELKSKAFSNFRFHQLDIIDENSINELFDKEKFDVVIHLAAQAGVRYSIEKPKVYVQSNIVGFINILEACRENNIQHLIYASSSSIYGNCEIVPFSEGHDISNPVSMYAVTKIADELMAKTYTNLYGLKTTGLRIFTVYGPWGRPDMAPFLFTKAILNDEPIKLFNFGELERDFTYIDDIVNGFIRIITKEDKEKVAHIFNLGNNKPVKLKDFISTLENICGKKAKIELLPMQPGDVYKTYADISLLNLFCGYKPSKILEEGLREFVKWYQIYNNK